VYLAFAVCFATWPLVNVVLIRSLPPAAVLAPETVGAGAPRR
jgi:hypothetical protein